MTSSALANRQTIVELVAAYEQAAAGIRVGFARIARAENDLTLAGGMRLREKRGEAA